MKTEKPCFGHGNVEYRTIDTSTEKGLQDAEKLHTTGWIIGSVGLFTIQFYHKKVKQNK